MSYLKIQSMAELDLRVGLIELHMVNALIVKLIMLPLCPSPPFFENCGSTSQSSACFPFLFISSYTKNSCLFFNLSLLILFYATPYL